jgi:amino acid adenylation domain-containing protein
VTVAPTFVHLLRERARVAPDRLAYVFLQNGEDESARLTVEELDAKAQAIAAALQERGGAGERALLLYPPGLDFVAAFFGCLYAGVIAVPSYPPAPARPGRGQPRLRSIVEDCAPRFVLTTESLAPRVAALDAEVPGLAAAEVLVTDMLSDGLAESWTDPEIGPETIAFLQYTSGSTSDPKGVMVTHGNLAHNEEVIREACRHDERSTFVSWLPIYHDMGLIGGVLQPLWVGATCVLMAPVAFLQRPVRWLRAIAKWRAHTSGAPDFAYDLCVRKITPEQREGLDLSSWRVAFDGAEPVRAGTLEAFIEAFGPGGFRRESFFPCYGLAEATLIVSGRRRPESPVIRIFQGLEEHRVEAADEGARLVGCGPAGLGLEIAIADPETLEEKESGGVGEIWVAGASVARGYWGRLELSEATFGARLAGHPGRTFLRTGDLGFLQEGELFVTGRIKDLIIVRGRNHYPQDLEATAAASHAALRGGAGAAFSTEGAGGESAAIIQEIDPRRTREGEEALGAVRQALAEEHEIPVSAVVLVKAGTIPKTTSGKVQRNRTRQLFLEGSLEPVAEWRAEIFEPTVASIKEPTDDLTAWLRARVAAKLGLRESDVDPNEPLARHGIDSLSAVELTHEIETTLGIELPLSALLEAPSLSHLAHILAEDHRRDAPTEDVYPPIHPQGRGVWAGELLAGERALWFLHQLEPTSPAYHIAGAARILGDVSNESLRRAFQAQVDRHPALRTTFELRDGEPVKRVHEAAEVDFRVEEGGEGEAAIAEEVFRLFDLEHGPLLRVRVFRRVDGERVLLVVIHHLIADFWSLAVLVRTLTPGPSPTHPPDPPGEGRGGSPVDEARIGFWQSQLVGYPFALEIPTDRARPARPGHRAAAVPFALDRETADRLRRLAWERGTTVFAALLAVFQTLLHRAAGQERLLVGAPTSGRSRAALAGEVGYFVNTVVLPSTVEDDPTFEMLLDRARRAVLDAFAREVPFPALVERLQPERDPGRTPLFQAAFALQKAPRREEEALAAFSLNVPGFRLDLGGISLESLALPVLPGQFDLTLVAAEMEGELQASLFYDLDLFEADTAVRMTEWLRNLAAGLVAEPGRRAGEVIPWSEAERRQVIEEWGGAEVPSLRPLIPERVAARALETPDAEAIRQGERSVTYAELARRAHGLAWKLRSMGVGPEVKVTVFAERRPETVMGLLAVLEAGGAYVPLEPVFPPERVARLVADAGARVLLTERALAARLPALSADLLFLDEPWEERAIPPPLEVQPRNLAYVIYTSGSTGRPKGAEISHEALRAFVERHEERFGIGLGDTVAHISGQGFDASILELWVPLANGVGVRMPEEDEVRSSPPLLLDWLISSGITHVFMTTALYEALLQLGPALRRPSRLRHLLTGGERLRLRPPADLPFEVWTNYGPTETTVLATSGRIPSVDQAGRLPSIGRPILGTRIVFLDRLFRPVPAGAPGELCLGGPGLGRGYLERPDQTAEKFIPDPFGPPGSRLYRSGDLGRWRPDGELEFIRRIDDQVKVRGFRVEPGEIERTLAQHPGVREAVVLAVDDPAIGKRLVAFVTPAGDEVPSARELREHLSATLPIYMVPSAFVALDVLPLTINTKVDRRALEAQAVLAAPEGEAAAPRDAIEETLAELWAAELGRERVGVHDDFFALGGHSLLGARLVARIRETLGADLSLRRLFETPTVAGLAEALRTSENAVPFRPVPRDGNLRPSIAQESLWFLDRLEPGMPTYNVPMEIRWTGELSISALWAALGAIVGRHEALRTRFPEVEGRLAVACGEEDGEAGGLLDLSGLPESLREAESDRIASAEARRPFDLERGPLSRAVLIWLADTEHRLLWTTHHIVSDGASLGVWLEELTVLYRAAREGRHAVLPELVIQPADVAAQERAALESGALEPQLAFWERRLAGAPVLELPSDRSRPVTPTSRGVLRTLKLPDGLGAAVTTLARQERATPFMALLATFAAFLSRIADQEDLVLGTPVSRRGRAELEPLVGFLVDTVAVRVSLAGEPAFRDLVGRVRRSALDAFRHADVPFEAVVERVRPERGLGRNPVFPVLFSVPPPLPTRIELPGAVLEPRGIATGTAKFDLSLFVRDEEGRLVADLEAALDLFDPETAGRLLSGWAVLLEAAVATPERAVTDLPLLGDAERAQLLTGWNDAGPIPPVEDRLDSLFRAQAARTPDAVALIAGEERLTYRELAERASRLADRLRELGAGPETVVGVSLPRTAELIVALLGILEAGAAYLPLDPAYPEERRRFLVADAGAEIVITPTQPSPPGPLSRHPAPPPRERGRERDLAYLIYTSGSTGRPKGVAIEHASAVRLVAWAAATYARDELAGVLASTSINFDLSVFEIFAPLSTGGTVILAEDALALPDLPARDEVTLINTVPSALAALLELGPLPASVRTVNVAGEPLRRSLAERFHTDGSRRLWNLYGPSEDTTYSTGALIGAEEPPIGRPVGGSRAYVVDRGLGLLPPGIPGELVLGGGGLARGYWRRPDLTAERFVPDPLAGEPGMRLYRTGDRVRWRPDGQLEFLGRFDHQVKIRGFRVEPGEIEAALMQHPQVDAATVLALPGPGGHLQLAAFVEGANPGVAELREHLASRLPSAFVPASFTVLDALPLNPNGKVDRAALARLGASPVEATGFVVPRDPVEELLAGIWTELLGIERVGIQDDFFSLGGHSLLATRVIARVRAVLGVELPVRSLFETPTVAGLAARIRQADASTQAPPLVPLPRGNDFSLSFAQERLWFLHRLDPGAATYNMAGALRLSGDLNVAALERTLREVVRRHESLRTTFPAVGGTPVQRIAPEPSFVLSRVDLAGSADEVAVAEGSRPFDLERGPVLRALLVRLGPAEHLLAVTMPHIVADGWSLGVLMREVGELYPVFAAGGTSESAAPPVQVADFAVWQREWLQGETLRSLLDWWRECLAGSEPGAGIPSDRPRPSGPLGSGGVVRFRLPAGLVSDMEALGRRRGATLFMTLLAGWKAVLHRWSGAEDLCVGAPIANRDRVEIEDVIGCFVNTLALRTVLEPAAGFVDLLERVRATTLGAYDHQDLPFEKLVEELRPDRTLAPNPLFQTLFALQNAPRPRLELPGLDLELVPVDLGAPKLDLALTVERDGGELAATLEYASELFDAATAERLARHWEILLAGAAADPERAVALLPLLTLEESRQILVDWIPARVPLTRSPLLHERFAEDAWRMPDAPAVRFEDQELTYAELELRTNRLAWHLISLGVRPGDRVGLGLERSAEAIEGILGILKAGAAWVPLDPAQPLERLAVMAGDAEIAALVTTGRLAGAIGSLAALLPEGMPRVLLDTDAASIAVCPAESPGLDLPETALAYVLYTSGSTGMPKGVCCPHVGVANLMDELERLQPLPPGTVCSQWASLSFDASVLEIFTPYTAGGCLDIVPDRVRTDGRALAAWMAEREIGRAFVPPALLADFAAGFIETPAPLLRLELGGEAVPLAPLATIAECRPEVCILDCYGPTEAAVAVTAWPLPADPPREGFALIGHPLRNVRVYVLSPEGEPAPVGVPGELFLAGIGVAQGYLGRPDLTAERFLPDPFSEEPGQRMYRAGDLARWTPSGDLAFLGRADDQVKIRGVRIEPGEVAAVLRQIPGIREAVVALRPGSKNEPSLVAWVISEPGVPMPSREALRARLPEAMIPSAFVTLETLPLTRHGKVHRAALPDPDWERPVSEHVPPRTPVEEMLAELWADLLGVEPVERIGVRDSFFDLGGHSLKAGQLVLRVRDLFGIELPVREVFESPTIEAMAVAIGRKLVEEADPDELAKILEEM